MSQIEKKITLVNTKSSPLAAYDGYQLNYEDPYGAGRISISGVDY